MSGQEQELAALLGDHSFHTGYAVDPEPWFSCGCGWRSKAIHRFTACTQHRHHIAEVIIAAGWVSPDAIETEWGVRYADFPDEIARRRSEDVVRREMTLCRKHGVDAVPVRRDVTKWHEADEPERDHVAEADEIRKQRQG